MAPRWTGRFSYTLPQRLAGALSAGELDVATRPPDGAGIARSCRTGLSAHRPAADRGPAAAGDAHARSAGRRARAVRGVGDRAAGRRVAGCPSADVADPRRGRGASRPLRAPHRVGVDHARGAGISRRISPAVRPGSCRVSCAAPRRRTTCSSAAARCARSRSRRPRGSPARSSLAMPTSARCWAPWRRRIRRGAAAARAGASIPPRPSWSSTTPGRRSPAARSSTPVAAC